MTIFTPSTLTSPFLKPQPRFPSRLLPLTADVSQSLPSSPFAKDVSLLPLPTPQDLLLSRPPQALESPAISYVKSERKKNLWNCLQMGHKSQKETIVSMAVAGAIIGAAFGGWMNDRFGRRISILSADILFFFVAIKMAVSPGPRIIILGRIFMGFGVGMASLMAPLYISEAPSQT